MCLHHNSVASYGSKSTYPWSCAAEEDREGPADGDDDSADPDTNDEESGTVEDIDKDIDDDCNVLEVRSHSGLQ